MRRDGSADREQCRAIMERAMITLYLIFRVPVVPAVCDFVQKVYLQIIGDRN